MSHKQRLKELHQKLKELADKHQAHQELHDCLNELDAEITAMADSEGGNGSNNPSHEPDLP